MYYNSISAVIATMNIVVSLIAFMSVERTGVQAADVGHIEDEFDTTIHGPWMKRWEIVHHNRHSASMLTSTGPGDSYKP